MDIPWMISEEHPSFCRFLFAMNGDEDIVFETFSVRIILILLGTMYNVAVLIVRQTK
jgi:hypothetical protein